MRSVLDIDEILDMAGDGHADYGPKKYQLLMYTTEEFYFAWRLETGRSSLLLMGTR